MLLTVKKAWNYSSVATQLSSLLSHSWLLQHTSCYVYFQCLLSVVLSFCFYLCCLCIYSSIYPSSAVIRISSKPLLKNRCCSLTRKKRKRKITNQSWNTLISFPDFKPFRGDSMDPPTQFLNIKSKQNKTMLKKIVKIRVWQKKIVNKQYFPGFNLLEVTAWILPPNLRHEWIRGNWRYWTSA